MYKFAAVAVMLPLLAVIQLAQETAPKPGAAVIARAERDVALLLPQRGVGGDAAGKVTPDKRVFSEIPIDVEGCEAMTGYMMLPEKLPSGRKVALMFTFHGNGDKGEGRVKNVSACSTERDPVITIGVQYQQLEPDGKGKMNSPILAKADKLVEGFRWLLRKTVKDYPVDPERVFVSGFSMGTGYASGWARREWAENPDAMPFRAVFLYSSGGSVTKETCPPIPFICTVGSEETAVLGSINVVAAVRQFCNVLSAWGKPVQYHEIPGMGHAVNGRCHQITRDVINELGGPGMLPYATENGAAVPEPLPFEASEDPYVKEAAALCNADQWQAALTRIQAIDADKSIAGKEKRALKSFAKEIEKVAKKEVKRVDDLMAEAMKSEKMPEAWQIRRVRAICMAWASETWIVGKGYDERLALLEGDFAPARREREREQMMRDALRLESQPDSRSEAKKKYAELAARADEDEGKSTWPKAAKYRLQWWQD
ncbi:MAG: hypothetical protein IPK87_01530 [Planctomycetes bacterium]|nr:hypothetical protein [Planctomycetota bacterium]